MQRHPAELVEFALGRPGATPGLQPVFTHHIARVAARFAHGHPRTAGLVGWVPLTAG